MLWAGAASIVLPLLPVLHWVLLPLVYLNTHYHEGFHALAAILTGGVVQSIQVFADGSGLAHVLGGSPVIVAFAGYPGATFVGAILLSRAGTESGARRSLKVMAVFLGVLLLLWVRSPVGVVTGVVWTGVLWLLAQRLSPAGVTFAAQFLGLQLALAALESVWTVLRISSVGEQVSDASILADLTGIPPMVWASSWVLFSLALVYAALRSAWRPVRA